MSTEMIEPQYGRASLSDVLPSIGAHLGIPGYRDDVLGLDGGQRYLVCLVDGLGWHVLLRHSRSAPYLASLMDRPLTAGVPSTTATSITSLGTGLTPGEHGIAGYRFREHTSGQVFSPLTWDLDVAASVVQPRVTAFQRAATHGLRPWAVTPSRFIGSGLTEAALRGTHMPGVGEEDDYQARVTMTCQAFDEGSSLVYAYERKLDHTGHSVGTSHPQFDERLSRIDAWCEQIRESLPDDVRMLITGDHGMLDIPQDHRVVLEDDPRLTRGLTDIGGEGRFRHLYCDRADVDAVAGRWTEVLGDRAWVLTREEVIERGWFGPVSPQVLSHFGDVMVAMRGTWAVMTRTLMGEWGLVGMHGSLTADEMLVPLLVD